MFGKKKFISINIAVLTVSDTRTIINDKSGDYIQKSILKAGHKCIETTFTFYAQSSDKALKKAITSINKPMSMIGHNRRKVD